MALTIEKAQQILDDYYDLCIPNTKMISNL